MSVFILETEAVSSAADGLSSIASKLENVSDTINGYDTSQSGGDNFDFDGAKAVIAANVKAASVKVKNTQTLMTSVVESHTQLQSALKYGETGKEKENSSGKVGNVNSSSPGYSGSYSGGHSGGHSGGYSSVVPVTPKDKDKDKDKKKEDNSNLKGIVPISKDKYVTDDSKKKKIATALSGVGLVAINKSLTEKEQADFNNLYDIKYTKEGLAKVGDRYVISCDKSYGEVGDMIDLKQKDGSYVKCIIGGRTNTTIEENKNNIRFITKEDVKDEAIIKTTQTIKKNTTEVYNAGPDQKNLKTTPDTTTPTDQPNTDTNTSTDTSNNTPTDTTTDTSNSTTTDTPNNNTQSSTTEQPNTNTQADSSSTQTDTTNTQPTENTEASEGITYTDQSSTTEDVSTGETVTDTTNTTEESPQDSGGN